MQLGPDFKTQSLIKSLNYDNSSPVDKEGKEIPFDTTLASKSSKQYQNQEENRKKKRQLIIDMQAYASTLGKDSNHVKLTSEKFNKNPVTTRKYLNMTSKEIESLNNLNE